VLKNTYSKKSRPNNSKSVAVGSRSQGGSIKLRTITVSQERRAELQKLTEEEKELGIQEDPDEDDIEIEAEDRVLE
jgi:hypothetical protein